MKTLKDKKAAATLNGSTVTCPAISDIFPFKTEGPRRTMKRLKNNFPAADQPKAIARFYRTVVAPLLKKKIGLVGPETAQHEGELAASNIRNLDVDFRIERGLTAAKYDADSHTVLLPACPISLGSVFRALAIADCMTDPANTTGTGGAEFFASLMTIMYLHEDLELSRDDLALPAVALGIEVEEFWCNAPECRFDATEQNPWEFWELAS